PTALLVHSTPRYRSIWARQDDAAISAVVEYTPVLLGVDEPSLAAWAAFDELLDQTAHLLPTAVLEARRQNPGMRVMATGRLVEDDRRSTRLNSSHVS